MGHLALEALGSDTLSQSQSQRQTPSLSLPEHLMKSEQ